MENQNPTIPYHAANVETVRLPRIQHQYLNVCLIMKSLISRREPWEPGAVYEVITLPRKKITTRFMLAVEGKKAADPLTITQFDQAVMDAVYTLAVNGCDGFTASMVARVISGNPAADCTETMMKAVRASMDKLRAVWIKIDCTAELKARKLTADWDPEKFYSPLLPLKDAPMRAGNNQTVTTGYALWAEPVLYRYAHKIRQIASVPADYLRTSSVRDTHDNIVIKRHLIRRIEALRNPKSKVMSPRISYEWRKNKSTPPQGFLHDLGYDKAGFANWRDKKSRLHGVVTGLLSDFTAAGYIDGFKVLRSGSSILGVEIMLNSKSGKSDR